MSLTSEEGFPVKYGLSNGNVPAIICNSFCLTSGRHCCNRWEHSNNLRKQTRCHNGKPLEIGLTGEELKISLNGNINTLKGNFANFRLNCTSLLA